MCKLEISIMQPLSTKSDIIPRRTFSKYPKLFKTPPVTTSPAHPFLDFVPQVMLRPLLVLLLSAAVITAKPRCPVCRDYTSLVFTDTMATLSSTVSNTCARALRTGHISPCPSGKVCKVFNAWKSSEVDSTTYHDEDVEQIGCYTSSQSCETEFPDFQCSSFIYKKKKRTL